MATVRRNAGASAPGRRAASGRQGYEIETIYIDGNNALRREPVYRQEVRPERKLSETTRKNREKALQMNMGYVLFLFAAAVLSVFVCVNYLQLQAIYTDAQKTNTARSTELSNLRLENDAAYNSIISSVNLEEVKDIAMNRLGMVYATSDQIVTYEENDNDYVRQYQDVPEN